MPRQAIQTLSQALEIHCLVHFTRAANLPSILAHGLYPISRKDEVGINPQINDVLRLDGHLDGTSLSITFPNFRMFFKYRQENPGVDWVVLGINPSVLWEKNCAFFCRNAADIRMSNQPLQALQTPHAMQGMFAEIPDIQSRTDQRLKSFDPTDAQAEVLVFDVIEPQLIFGIRFTNNAALNASRHLCGARDLRVDSEGKGLFASRSYVR
ncbi:DarT ssDNA thymidine ADP-ribosyltransferase family protein [Pseudomonas sp. S2_D10]